MEDNWKIPRQPAPPGMYEKVRSRLVEARAKAARARRHLAAASLLLLVVSGANLAATLAFRGKISHEPSPENVLRETYFKTQTLMQ